MPGSHEANEDILNAITGNEVDPRNRVEHSLVDVQGGHGSAQIPLLHATNAAWYFHWRNDTECRKVMQAWHGYMALDLWYTKEPYTIFRYRNWIMISYIAMHALALERGDDVLAARMARYIRYSLLTPVLSMGWRKNSDNDYFRGSFPVASGGSRSWVAPHPEGQPYELKPYPGLADWNDLGIETCNALGIVGKATWEVEPVLRALAQKVNYRRWPMIDASDKNLCRRLIDVRSEMEDDQLDDLETLLDLIADTGARAKIATVWIKTTGGVGWVAERSAAAGSTTFKFGGVWCANGRIESEYPEVWAHEIPEEFGWLHEGGHQRRSDPGGEGWYEILPNGIRLHCMSGDGKCGNDFVPGDDKHYEQWRSTNPSDPAGWRDGPRSITLPGDLVWMVRIRERGRGIEILHPTSGDSSEPPDMPGDKPGTGKLRAARRTLEAAEIRWNVDAGPRKARRAIRQINQALARRG